MSVSTETVSLVPLAEAAVLGEVLEAPSSPPSPAPELVAAPKPKRARAKAVKKIVFQEPVAPKPVEPPAPEVVPEPEVQTPLQSVVEEPLEPEIQAPEIQAPEIQTPVVPEPAAPEPAALIKAKAKRAPRPQKRKVPPVEVIEYEDEPPTPHAPQPDISNEDILQHLLNHRVRQRVQREQFYQSFVSQF